MRPPRPTTGERWSSVGGKLVPAGGPSRLLRGPELDFTCKIYKILDLNSILTFSSFLEQPGVPSLQVGAEYITKNL